MSDFEYSGIHELELYSNANHWREYWSSEFSKFLNDNQKVNLLEVGCGTGSNFQNLKNFAKNYYGVEPDKKCYEIAQRNIMGKIIHGTLTAVDSLKFDIIVYVDVLEHISNDSDQVRAASQLLEFGGYLLIIVPAHPHLYSKFDKKVGHYRRYSKKALLDLRTEDLEIISIRQLDFIGYLFSLLNRILNNESKYLKQAVFLWNYLVPISQKIDALFPFLPGKSFTLVMKKRTN